MPQRSRAIYLPGSPTRAVTNNLGFFSGIFPPFLSVCVSVTLPACLCFIYIVHGSVRVCVSLWHGPVAGSRLLIGVELQLTEVQGGGWSRVWGLG